MESKFSNVTGLENKEANEIDEDIPNNQNTEEFENNKGGNEVFAESISKIFI